MTPHIAILGDFNPAYATHHALNDSTRHLQTYLNEEIQFDWIATDTFHSRTVFQGTIPYKGLWIAPGSPYKDMENVLNIISYARQNNVPTLGNCGGFQHIVIEFARTVCGIANADHAETNPDTPDAVISKLSCSLVEQEERLSIADTSSLLYSIVQNTNIVGRYFCSYGINPNYVETLQSNGLRFTAQSEDGQMRAFELPSHPFFLGTLFQPALSSTADSPNPILLAFVEKCLSL